MAMACASAGDDRYMLAWMPIVLIALHR